MGLQPMAHSHIEVKNPGWWGSGNPCYPRQHFWLEHYCLFFFFLFLLFLLSLLFYLLLLFFCVYVIFVCTCVPHIYLHMSYGFIGQHSFVPQVSASLSFLPCLVGLESTKQTKLPVLLRSDSILMTPVRHLSCGLPFWPYWGDVHETQPNQLLHRLLWWLILVVNLI